MTERHKKISVFKQDSSIIKRTKQLYPNHVTCNLYAMVDITCQFTTGINSTQLH